MLERTTDAEYIYQCLTDPYVWRSSMHDDAPDKDLYFVPTHDPYVWVKAGQYGLFLFIHQGEGTYEIHLALNQMVIGKAKEVTEQAIEWAMRNIDGCNRLTASIPAFNHQVMGLARRVGFKQTGIIENAFKRGGKDYDMHIFTFNKGNQ